MKNNSRVSFLSGVALISIASGPHAFLMPSSSRRVHSTTLSTTPPHQLRMSFMADSSDYKNDKSDTMDDDSTNDATAPLRGEVDMADVPVTEEIPVPMSRNNVGNRFVAVIYDNEFNNNSKGGGGGDDDDV